MANGNVPATGHGPDFWSEAPKGIIVLWASTAAIPRGWTVCNGTNGTPNLDGRFPLGTVNSAEIGQQVGAASHTHGVSGVTAHENKHEDQRTPYGMQGEGNECMFHDHNFSATTDSQPNLPLSTKIMFIMKMN